ncbi:TPA: hypothetical protein ACH3X1_001841 [Trebouxia sp. C0004]
MVKHFTDTLLAMSIPKKDHIANKYSTDDPALQALLPCCSCQWAAPFWFSDQGSRELAFGVDREQQCMVFVKEARAHYQLNTIIADFDGTPIGSASMHMLLGLYPRVFSAIRYCTACRLVK